MAIGPGTYDHLCTLVRERAHARAAVVIVIDGADGHGFSVQADLVSSLVLADVLENVAREIRKSGLTGAGPS